MEKEDKIAFSVILVILFAMTFSGLANFDPQTVVDMGAREIPLEEGNFIPAPAPALPAWSPCARLRWIHVSSGS